MEIIPAILPRNFFEIEEKIELIKGLTNLVQIDICDGKFTPTPSWPYVKKDENFEAILREEKGMPEWEKVDYEFDLMIDNPNTDDIRQWLSAGATRIVLHNKSSKDLNEVLDILNGLVEIGIAIENINEIEDIKKYLNKIQFVQIMGIKKIGFQGQKFDMDTIEKIKELKKEIPDIKIQIDGGVSLDNASILKNAGVDRLVVGSALFESDNIVDTFEKFERI